ncbi:hypothetical protein GF415_00225 [Candidatus Micrarchaeota archaeon]|nr:hypothetical protein [Candidatus Micrarchaeota archaeon]
MLAYDAANKREYGGALEKIHGNAVQELSRRFCKGANPNYGWESAEAFRLLQDIPEHGISDACKRALEKANENPALAPIWRLVNTVGMGSVLVQSSEIAMALELLLEHSQNGRLRNGDEEEFSMCLRKVLKDEDDERVLMVAGFCMRHQADKSCYQPIMTALRRKNGKIAPEVRRCLVSAAEACRPAPENREKKRWPRIEMRRAGDMVRLIPAKK